MILSGTSCATKQRQTNEITKQDLREKFGWNPGENAIDDEAAKIISSGLINVDRLTTVDGRTLTGREAFNQMIVDFANASYDIDARQKIAVGDNEALKEMRKNGIYKDYADMISRTKGDKKIGKSAMAMIATGIAEAHESFKRAGKDSVTYRLDFFRRNITNPSYYLQKSLQEGMLLRQTNRAEVAELNSLHADLMDSYKSFDKKLAYEYMINKWEMAYHRNEGNLDEVSRLRSEAANMRSLAAEKGIALNDIVEKFNHLNTHGFIAEADAAIEYFKRMKTMFSHDATKLAEITALEKQAIGSFVPAENLNQVLQEGSFRSWLNRNKMYDVSDAYKFLKSKKDIMFRDNYVPTFNRMGVDADTKTIPELISELDLNATSEALYKQVIALKNEVQQRYSRKETRKQFTAGPEVKGNSSFGYTEHVAEYTDLVKASAQRIGNKYQRAHFLNGIQSIAEFAKHMMENPGGNMEADFKKLVEIYAHNYKQAGVVHQLGNTLRSLAGLKYIGFSGSLSVKQFFQTGHAYLALSREVLNSKELSGIPSEFMGSVKEYRDKMLSGLVESDITMTQEDFLTAQQLVNAEQTLIEEHQHQWRINKGLQKAMTKSLGWSPLCLIPFLKDTPLASFSKADQWGKNLIVERSFNHMVKQLSDQVDWSNPDLNKAKMVKHIQEAAMKRALTNAERSLGGTATTGSAAARNPITGTLLQFKTVYWPQFVDSSKQAWNRLNRTESSQLEKITRQMLNKVGIPVKQYGRMLDIMMFTGGATALSYFFASMLGSNGTDYMNLPPAEILTDLLDEDSDKQKMIEFQLTPPVWSMLKDIGVAISASTMGMHTQKAADIFFQNLAPSQGKRFYYDIGKAYQAVKKKDEHSGIDIAKASAHAFTGFYMRNKDHGYGGYRSQSSIARKEFWEMVNTFREQGYNSADAFMLARDDYPHFSKLPQKDRAKAELYEQTQVLQHRAEQLKAQYSRLRSLGAPQAQLKRLYEQRSAIYNQIDALYSNGKRTAMPKPDNYTKMKPIKNTGYIAGM